jgi:hypothetical protein
LRVFKEDDMDKRKGRRGGRLRVESQRKERTNRAVRESE